MLIYMMYHESICNKYMFRYFGVKSDRLSLCPQSPWIDHLFAKTSLDMILDTPVKNGHTTGLDGLWAGVPTVTLGGGKTMPSR